MLSADRPGFGQPARLNRARRRSKRGAEGVQARASGVHVLLGGMNSCKKRGQFVYGLCGGEHNYPAGRRKRQVTAKQSHTGSASGRNAVTGSA